MELWTGAFDSMQREKIERILSAYGLSRETIVTIPTRPPRYINFFEPFHYLADDQLVIPIGTSYISLPLQEIQSMEREKKEQTNNMPGVNSSAEWKLCNIVHK